MTIKIDNLNLKIDMKIYNINQFEKLKINKIQLDDLNDIKIIEHHYFPESGDELKELIKKRIIDEGPNCDLNDIDVSKVKDMSYMFDNIDMALFNGDISRWDVSKVMNMNWMFHYSCFNGDISKWDVSNVETMQGMFSNSIFNNDISKWDVSNVKYMNGMFNNSVFNQDISQWDVSNVEYMTEMFYRSKFDGDISNWNVSNVTSHNNMFDNCILYNYKNKQPKFKN